MDHSQIQRPATPWSPRMHWYVTIYCLATQSWPRTNSFSITESETQHQPHPRPAARTHVLLPWRIPTHTQGSDGLCLTVPKLTRGSSNQVHDFQLPLTPQKPCFTSKLQRSASLLFLSLAFHINPSAYYLGSTFKICSASDRFLLSQHCPSPSHHHFPPRTIAIAS